MPQDRLSELAGRVPMPVAGVDRTGRLIYINDVLRELVGFEGDEANDVFFWEAVAEPGAQACRERFLSTVDTGVDPSFETLLIRPDGSEVVVSWHTVPFFDEDGRLESAFAVGANITALRSAEDRLAHLNVTLQALSGVAGLALRTDDPSELLQRACDVLTSTGACTTAWIALLGDDGRPVGLIGSSERDGSLLETEPRTLDELPSCMAQMLENLPQVDLTEISDVCEQCPFSSGDPTETGIATAIRHGPVTLGILVTHVREAQPVGEETRRVFSSIGADLGFALTMLEARAMHARTESSLAEKTRMLDAFFNNSLDPAAILDRDFNFVRVNQAYARSCALEPHELIGQNHFAFFPHEENQAIFEHVRDSGEPFHVQAKPFEYPDHPEWGMTWWDWTLVPLRGESAEVELLSFWLRDVTEEHRARQALQHQRDRLDELVRAQTEELRQGNELLRAVFDESPIAKLVVDHDMRVTMWNPGAEELTGWSAGEVVGRTSPLISAENEDEATTMFARVLAGEVLNELPIRRQHRDGSMMDLRLSAAPLRGDTGEITAAVAVLSDETERLSAQCELQATNEVLQALIASSPVAIVMNDLEGLVTLWNPAAERITGWREEEVLGRRSPIVPDERLGTHLAIFDRLRAGDSVMIETERRHKDGSPLHLEITAAPLRNAAGETTGFLGLLTDIGDRVRAQEERELLLRQLEEERATLEAIVQNAPEGIILTDAQARIILANPASEAIYQRPAPIGLDREVHSELQFCYPDGTLYDVDDLPLSRSALRGEVVHTQDLAIIWPDGQQRDLEASSAPIRTPDGEITGAVGIFWDVTDTKAGERERGRLMALLEDYANHLEEMVSERTRELAQSRDELQTQRDFVDAVIENAGGLVMVVDSRGRIVRFNETCEEVSGYSADEVRGCDFVELLIPEEDRAEVEADFFGSLRDGRTDYEDWWRRKDGTLRRISWGVSTINDRDGNMEFMVGTGWDVTEEYRVAQRLRESEAKYRELVESARTIIVHWDLNATIRFMNEYGLEFFGYTEEELIGADVGILVPGTDSHGNDVTGLAQSILATPDDYVMNENENITKDGRLCWVSWSNRVVRDDSGAVTGIMAVGVDRTAQKSAEEQLHASRENLRELTAEVALVEQRERREIATVLHDNIGQLLAFGKLKLSGMLKKGTPDPEGLQELLRYMDEAIAETRSLTTQLSPPALEQLGFVAALEWLADGFSERHGVPVEFIASPHPEDLGEEIEITLFQATRELITNAIKHARATQVTLRLGMKDADVCIEVADDGVGFDLDAIKERTRRQGGFGLLNVQERITYLGGAVEIASTPELGTTITIICPIAAKETTPS